MDHHRQNHHPRHHHHPPPPRHLNSPSRYLPLHPHQPPPPPPPPSFPENHPSFPPKFTFINSPPHHHQHQFHHPDDVIYRSPPSRPPPLPHPSDDNNNNRLQFYDSHNPNHDDLLPPRFRLNELPHHPLPPPPTASHQHHHPRVPPMSPVARRSPPQFVQFDRFERQFDEDFDLNSRARLPLQQQQHQQQNIDSIDFPQFRVDDDVDDRRIEYDRDWERNRDERYYSEMMRRRNEFEANSVGNDYDRLPVNDESLIRGGRRDSGRNLGFEEKNLSKRYPSGGDAGGREVSRSPIKFRIGAAEGDDRFSSRGRKEEVQEYNNRGMPRKSVQKKSALLRIQPGKPQHHSGSGGSNFRNRFDNGTGSSNSSPHKGNKESNSEFVDSNSNRVGEERVGSPVELDVSFKSNALVAKAIMAPPSCSGVEVNVNNAVSGSGTTRIDSKSPAKVTSHKLKSVVSVKVDKEKESKNKVKVSPIRKRVGNQSNVGKVRGSESSPGGSSSVSGGVARKVSTKGKVLVKDDKNAGLKKVASPVIRKKRKAVSQLSRLSSSPVPSKTDSELVNVDGSLPSSDVSVKQSDEALNADGSLPSSDVLVKQSDEPLNVTASPQNEFVDIVGTLDINEAPTVVEQEDIVGQSVSEASPPKEMRETGILESFPDESESLGSEFSEGHKITKVLLQDEQRSLNPDDNVTKSVEKCSSENHSEKDSVKGQDMAAVYVNNCSVEGSSELGKLRTGDNLDTNDICSGIVDAVNSVPVMSFILSTDHVTNNIKDEVDLTRGIVDGDRPCETKVLSSPENAITGLSLGGLYSDKIYEPEVMHSQHNAMLVGFSNDADKPCQTQVCSSPENVNIGLSLGGLYSDRNNETELGRFKDIAKIGNCSNDESGDKNRTSCSYDVDDVAIDLEYDIVSDVRVANDIQEKQYQRSDTALGNNDSLLGRDEVPTACISPFTVKEDNFQVNRKRKLETELDSLDTRVYESSHEMSLSFSVENAMLPVEKLCSAAPEQPCIEPNVSNGNENAVGSVKDMNSLNHVNDLDQIQYSSGSGKKRKVLLEKSVFCDVPGSESSDLPSSTMTLIPVANGASASFFPQLVEGFEPHKPIITGEDAAGSATDSLCAEISKSDFPDKGSCLSAAESAPQDAEQSYLPESEYNHKMDENLVMAEANDENGVIALKLTCSISTSDGNSSLQCLSSDHTMDVDQGPVAISTESNDNKMATDENSSFLCPVDHTGDVNPEPLINMVCDDNRIAANNGSSVLPSLSTYHSRNVDGGSIAANMECDDSISLNASSSSFSSRLQSGAEAMDDGVAINFDRLDVPSNVDCLGTSSLVSPTLDTSNARPAIQVHLGEQPNVDDKILNQSSATQSLVSSKVNVLPESSINNSMPSISASLAVQPLARKSVPVPSKNIKTTLFSSNSLSRLRSNVLTRSEAIPSTSQRTPVVKSSKKTHNYPAKPRTWYRANNLPASNVPVKKPAVGTPLHKPMYGKAVKVQDTSYIRKGNSLVRNPVSDAATSGSCAIGSSSDRSKPNDSHRIRKVVGPVVPESTELPDSLVTGGRSAPIEMPKTPPLSCSGKTPDDDVVHSGECTSSLPIDQSEGTDNEETIKFSDSPLNASGDPISVTNRTLEDPGVLSDGDLLGSCSKRMVYIKRKSNQLIAASKSSQLSVHNMGKAAASSSDKNYYKRRKNQLIRASSDGNIQQMVAVMNSNSKAISGRVSHAYSGRSSAKRPSNKVKSTKFSLVWKLGDSKSSGKGDDALRSGRLLSHLLPWKRTTHWSRKLLSSRKRGAVYVRSGRGFSLRRSKVTSLPGTSLKWSKSMEKHSKKVEEDAALAVAALDSVQKSGSSGVTSKAASSSHSLHKVFHGLKLHPGERIYRIGVFRYRMDPSRRTLQRISDEEGSEFTASKTEKDVRKSYVPKRLLIGSDEYVRIGNGNQLIRDPKRRTRILASEKVRWSLHTARMRLAKKRKFCQFFTRFGKCNKGEGKCPFIHDPSKIAVCTKFLNGLCADQNCKLTHEVIPERMPDCSFYLQGLCSNEKCPYRHVNVNPKASVCENFLRGYCAEGNECRKKHSYSCPEFEASGSCPQGSKCKLYHPKKVKSKKRKVSRDQNNAKGRYFGSDLSVVADPESRPMLEKPVEPSNGNISIEGDLGDFISLDVGDNETLENGLISEPTKDSPLDLQLDDLDEMIKPRSILGAL